jgi:predicted ATPase
MMSHDTFLTAVFLKGDRVSSFDRFPFSIPAIKNLPRLELSPVTFFIGENGTGKTTLLEAIAMVEGFNREGGSRNFHFASNKDWKPDDLAWAIGVARPPRRIKGSDGFFVRAESFFNVASEIDRLAREPGGGGLLSYYGGKSLHARSHGEGFLTLFTERFGGNGLYLLDEPESALSPQRQLTFLTVIHDLIERGSQFLIATHSPIIMAYPGATIYQFTDKGVERIDYEQTPHYRITRAFLMRREQMLAELFAE